MSGLVLRACPSCEFRKRTFRQFSPSATRHTGNLKKVAAQLINHITSKQNYVLFSGFFLTKYNIPTYVNKSGKFKIRSSEYPLHLTLFPQSEGHPTVNLQ